MWQIAHTSQLIHWFKYKNILESFDGAPCGVVTMAGTLTLPGETNNTVVLDALGHHGTESIA